MKRLLNNEFKPIIQKGENYIPKSILKTIGDIHYFCGVCPVYAGLHNYQITSDGRSYSDTAHVSYSWMNTDKNTTVVLPDVYDTEPWVIVHELAHVLHERLNFRGNPISLTNYAETDRFEAFAEFFTVLYCPDVPDWYFRKFGSREKTLDVLYSDKKSLKMFNELE